MNEGSKTASTNRPHREQDWARIALLPDETTLAPGQNQTDTTPLVRSFERIAAPLQYSDRIRNYIVTLPPQGIEDFSRELNSAIDSGLLPVASVDFFVDNDPEEGFEELVARINVSMNAEAALDAWEAFEDRLHDILNALKGSDKRRMRDGFSFELRWLDDYE